MNNLTLKVAALVAVLYTGWAHADELPLTAEYGTTYDMEILTLEFFSTSRPNPAAAAPASSSRKGSYTRTRTDAIRRLP